MGRHREYVEATKHLTPEQQTMYRMVEHLLLTISPTDEGFINSLIAVEALSKTMRMSHETYLKRCH
jgi:hypothetical protein